MRLRLDLQGMRIDLEIKGYHNSNSNNKFDNWCQVSYSFVFPDCINYSKQDDEILLSCEVEDLKEMLDDFIDGKITEKITQGFIEPDFEFVFIPPRNKFETGECVCATTGFEMSPPVVEWKIQLWDGGLTDNYFSTTLTMEEIKAFRDYLSKVIDNNKQ